MEDAAPTQTKRVERNATQRNDTHRNDMQRNATQVLPHAQASGAVLRERVSDWGYAGGCTLVHDLLPQPSGKGHE